MLISLWFYLFLQLLYFTSLALNLSLLLLYLFKCKMFSLFSSLSPIVSPVCSFFLFIFLRLYCCRNLLRILRLFVLFKWNNRAWLIKMTFFFSILLGFFFSSPLSSSFSFLLYFSFRFLFCFFFNYLLSFFLNFQDLLIHLFKRRTNFLHFLFNFFYFN